MQTYRKKFANFTSKFYGKILYIGATEEIFLLENQPMHWLLIGHTDCETDFSKFSMS